MPIPVYKSPRAQSKPSHHQLSIRPRNHQRDILYFPHTLQSGPSNPQPPHRRTQRCVYRSTINTGTRTSFYYKTNTIYQMHPHPLDASPPPPFYELRGDRSTYIQTLTTWCGLLIIMRAIIAIGLCFQSLICLITDCDCLRWVWQPANHPRRDATDIPPNRTRNSPQTQLKAYMYVVSICRRGKARSESARIFRVRRFPDPNGLKLIQSLCLFRSLSIAENVSGVRNAFSSR